MEIKRIMVIGAGFMGSGIAQVMAAAGYEVLLMDIADDFVRKGMAAIEKNLNGSVAKGKLSGEQKGTILGRIMATTELASAKDCDLVIEAIIENKKAKMDLYRQLEEICPPHVLFASNTSSIPITELATATKRPDKFAGMHFFSPVPVMKLVEIIRGLKTADATVQAIKELTDRIGKVGVFVKDGPGFLVNRVNAALRNEVYNCLAEGVATIEDIDKAMKFGLGHPMGPFELGDFVGLEIGLAVAETLWENFKDPRWRPSLTLRKLVSTGDLGRKTGKGWYDYTSGEQKPRTDINW
ncbi:MAG: 3-hydroxyacyl-CoA dehydrogenase NAD-binding domain-containing protein [Deltaproteobacteria bacterium]|nr:3-hydroxyacyl-CoA dehydrogenase NAD-binding domain-containing protein [Deltaproteobacteria bacterium]